MTIDTINALK